MIEWIVAAALIAAPTQAAKNRAEKPMEWKGQYGGPLEPGHETALDAKAWARLWARLGQAAPALDFTKYFAVAVFVGEKPTGGFTVEFLEPTVRDAGLALRYRIKEPGGFSTQAIAQPWKVRAFARVKGKVSVEASEK